MADSLAWLIVPIVNEEGTQATINISLIDSDLNIQYNTTFSYPIPNSITTAPLFTSKLNQSNAIIDNNNNLIYAIISFSQSTINIYKVNILKYSQEFTISINIPSLNIWNEPNGTSSYDVSTNINLLSNNNYLITLIVNFNNAENVNIFYYILDENFNLLTEGSTPYNGTISLSQKVFISTSDNRICIGNTIYDNNFNIINPNINIGSINSEAFNLLNIYSFSLQYVNNNYSLMLLTLYNGNGGIYTVYAILGDLNGNIIYYIELSPISNYFSPYLLLNYLSDTLITYLISDSNSELTIYQLNFKTQSSEIIYTFPNINPNPILYNYQYNIIYPMNPNLLYTYLPEMESNKSNIPTTGYTAILSNGQLMNCNTSNQNLYLYDYNFTVIKSKQFDFINYNSYLTITIVPLFYSQNNLQKNMNIVYNPLLCKMYTANELLELS